MNYSYYTVDVFTDQPFMGVPISVVDNTSGLTVKQMQQIANETCTSNTVFVFKHEQFNSWQVKVFTPFSEIEMSVHNVLAATHVIASSDKVDLVDQHTLITLINDEQKVDTYVTKNNGNPSIIQQTYHTHAAIDHYTPTTNELAAMLSLTPSDIGFDHYQSLIVSCGKPYLIVPIKSYHAVREARFDLEKWTNSSAPASLAQEIFLFANNTDSNPADFHGRLLGPAIAIHEDPPIGGVLAAFANHICAHEHVQEGTHTLAIQRGANETRKSFLHMEMDNKKSNDLTIRVGGTAVITSKSTLLF